MKKLAEPVVSGERCRSGEYVLARWVEGGDSMLRAADGCAAKKPGGCCESN
jgi:hypothetical protein